MAWIRLDDGFADHPKILAAGPLAAILQVRALCWSSRHLTDGFIPPEALPGLLVGFGDLGIETAYVGNPPIASFGHQADECDWPALMVDAGLWEPHQHGYLIHDFLAYNPCKRDVLVMREQKRKAGKRGGIQSGKRRSKREAQCLPSAMPSGSEIPNSPSHTPKDKNIYGEFVRLTPNEHDKLLLQFGQKGTIERIATLDHYIGSKGKRYVSHYHTILSWEQKNGAKPEGKRPEIVT